MTRSNLPTIPSTISVSSRERRATTLRRRHDASPGTADSNLDRSVSGKMWLDWWSASHDQCHRKSGKVGKGGGPAVYTNKLAEIKDHRRQKTQRQNPTRRSKRNKISGGGGPVFSSDSALHSRRVSRFVRPSVRRWIIPSKKMKNFQERVTRRDVLFHGNTGEGELLSSEREAEGNLRESISPGQSYRAYVSSVCLWRGMRNISSGLISRLSCISFPPFALPSRSLPGINLFSSPSQRS